jgi:hypothetical protein
VKANNRDDVDHLIELHDVYDGWSIAVLKDGTLVNRWAGYADYERRARKTQDEIDAMLAARDE